MLQAYQAMSHWATAFPGQPWVPVSLQAKYQKVLFSLTSSPKHWHSIHANALSLPRVKNVSDACHFVRDPIKDSVQFWPCKCEYEQIPADFKVQNAKTETASDFRQYGRLVCNHSNKHLLLSSTSARPQAVSQVCFSLMERLLHSCLSGQLGSSGEHQRANRSRGITSSVKYSSARLFNLQKSPITSRQQFSCLELEMWSFSGQTHLLKRPHFQLGCKLCFSDGFAAVGHDGVSDCGSATWAHWTGSHLLCQLCHLWKRLMVTLACIEESLTAGMHL